MKEIRNFKGEVVQREVSYGDRWWHWSREVWGCVFGLLFLLLGVFVPYQSVLVIQRFLNPRLWSWEHFTLLAATAGYLFCCWSIYRNWENYSGAEERRAKNFIIFGVTALVILYFLLILSIAGRFGLFFRPLGQMFARGRFSLAAVWRLALIVVACVPLIHFGKEWILGFWEE